MDSNNELLKAGRVLALKIMAETYLLSKGNKKTDEIFLRTPESVENLVTGDLVVLHAWLVEEYERLGLDLVKAIEANGEQVDPNKLSQYEINELIARADQMLTSMLVIKKYEDAKNNR